MHNIPFTSTECHGKNILIAYLRQISVFLFWSILISIFGEKLYANGQKSLELSIEHFSYKQEKYLALVYKNYPGWHSYWKNPGNSGTSVENKFETSNKDITFVEMEWPIPKVFSEESLIVYGYDSVYVFFYKIKNLKKLSKIKLHSKWLACKSLCLPGEKIVSFDLDSTGITNMSEKNSFISDKEFLRNSFEKLPIRLSSVPKNFSAQLVKTGNSNEILLTYNIEYSSGDSFYQSSFARTSQMQTVYPFAFEVFTYHKETSKIDNSIFKGQIPITWEGAYFEEWGEIPHSGVLKKNIDLDLLLIDPLVGEGRIFTVSFTRVLDVVKTSEEKMKDTDIVVENNFSNIIKTENTKQRKQEDDSNSGHSILLILIIAFLGGLILNIMPCVLPVLSIKIYALINQREKLFRNERAGIFKDSILYSAGIIFTFFVFATIAVILKGSGESIGWGFHLQSKTFVFFMIIVLLVMSLSFFGLFHFQIPYVGKWVNIKIRNKNIEEFGSGVLSTLLSTPCSAPFLGTALTFAFTTSYLNIFLIFFVIGIGLAFPVLLVGVFPGLIVFLPRPGNWMNKVKNVLGVLLLLTAAWLIYVLFNLVKVESDLITDLNPMSQHEKDIVHWNKWSPELVEQTQGVSFISFTAKWCITCNVNKKVVFESEEFKKFIATNNINLFEADWTNKNEVISKWLETKKIFGVPAYFLKTKNDNYIYLGELISVDKIKIALEE